MDDPRLISLCGLTNQFRGDFNAGGVNDYQLFSHVQSLGRKKGCDDHREIIPSQELETKRKACRWVRHPKLLLSNSVCVSADGSWGKGGC